MGHDIGTLIWTKVRSGDVIPIRHLRVHNVDIEEIGDTLEMLHRWGGMSPVPCTVAAHSIMVADRLQGDPRLRLLGLLHDAHEAFTGDITRTTMELLGSGAKASLALWQRRADAAIRDKLELAKPTPDELAAVNAADEEQNEWEYERLWRQGATLPQLLAADGWNIADAGNLLNRKAWHTNVFCTLMEVQDE